ncbi:MAG: type III pantothenate kinase [Bacillota bacterium]
MILVIDVSNTTTTLGIFDKDTLISSWRLSTTSSRSSDETGILFNSLFQHSTADLTDVEDVVISSVVPDLMHSLINAIRKYLKKNPLIVSSGLKTGIKLSMENPKEMGTSRIVNMVAAREICDGDVLVINYDTATTFDVVDQKGEFVTGFTAPGLQTCAEALYQKAANLPKFEIKRPDSLITKNTIDSMQCGLVIGHIGETLYLIDLIKKELNMPDIKIIATGGLARVIDETEEIFDVYDPYLTLHGLRLLFEKNERKRWGGQKCY